MSTSISHSAANLAAADSSPAAASSAEPVAGPVAGKRGSQRSGSRLARWAVALAATCLFVGVGYLVIRTQGFVSGTEFSPTHFQQREFEFYEIPLLHWQITPIHRSASTPATATYIRQHALIPAAIGVPNDWHLASLSRGLAEPKPADAQLLLWQLTLSANGDPVWRTWSIEHPQHAKLLWPVVQRLAERELYILLPRLFEIAQIERPLAEFQPTLEAYLKKEYHDLIVDLDSAGRSELANALWQEARQDFPDDPALQSIELAGMNPTASP